MCFIFVCSLHWVCLLPNLEEEKKQSTLHKFTKEKLYLFYIGQHKGFKPSSEKASLVKQATHFKIVFLKQFDLLFTLLLPLSCFPNDCSC